jgi:hypothetical protein
MQARPDTPHGWNTLIPELLISPFTQQDYDQVRECISVIAPIEARGMKVVTRVELAAALLCSACDHAYVSGEEDAQGDGPKLFALTEELVLRRADLAQGTDSGQIILHPAAARSGFGEPKGARPQIAVTP